MSDPNVVRISPQSASQQILQKEVIQQTESAQDFMALAEEGAFSPSMMMRRFRTLEEQKQAQNERASAKEETKKTDLVKAVTPAEKTADNFQQKNDELNAKTLLILRARISPKDTPEEIIKKVKETYADAGLSDEALSFLEETTDFQNVKDAKENFAKTYAREIE